MPATRAVSGTIGTPGSSGTDDWIAVRLRAGPSPKRRQSDPKSEGVPAVRVLDRQAGNREGIGCGGSIEAPEVAEGRLIAGLAGDALGRRGERVPTADRVCQDVGQG